MRKPLLLIGLQWILLSAMAQNIDFKFSGGISDADLSAVMEKRVSGLLTELNAACAQNRELQLASFHLTSRASQSLQLLWKNFHFSCNDSKIRQLCLQDVNGYEIRGVAITLTPMGSNFKGELNRELTICFAPDKEITGVHMALANNSFASIVGKGRDVTDTRRRLEILKFVEDFRSYYDEKDLEALRNVYSDDALIITGKVIHRRNLGHDQAQMKLEIVYSKQNKEQYLSSLQRVFQNNKFIRVQFDSISVRRHPAKAGFYAVTLHQKWQSSNYSDDGYVFLLWEFKEGASPVVHVRTWQPDMIGSQKLDEDDVFNENDFFIP